MSGVVKNGRRAAASFGPWSGTAGVQNRDGGLIEVAFRADPKSLRGVKTGTIGGDAVTVLKIERSAWVAGMVLITFEPVAEGDQDNE